MNHDTYLCCTTCKTVLDHGCTCCPITAKVRTIDPLSGYCEPCIDYLDLRVARPSGTPEEWRQSRKAVR